MLWQLLTLGLAALAGAQTAPAKPAATPFPTSCTGVSANRYPYSVDSGWQVTKLLGGLKLPRTVVFDTSGNMLVLQQNTGISVHTFGTNGCVNSTTTLLSMISLNHGLSLTPDGKTLYASSQTTAYRWAYDPATRKLSGQTTVVAGMGTGIHSTRTLSVVPNNPNLIILACGSNNNWDYAAGNVNTGRAIVKVFNMSAVPSGGYQYNTQGWPLGYGLRNEVALAFDPNGHVWGVENSGDDFTRTVNGNSVDIHKDNPAEELNFLGDPTKPNNNWFGYPTCFTVWSPSLITDRTFKVGDQFVVAPNTSFPDANCATQSTPPRLSFQAHMAPIGAAFDTGAKNMYITFHGSWDRQPGSGYKLVEVPFTQLASGQYDPVAPADSTTAGKDVMWAQSIDSCQAQSLTQSNCWRLSGVTWDPAGTRLIVSSDNQAEGELFVLQKKTT